MLPRNWDGIANYAVNFTPVPANRPTGDHVAVRPLCRAILQSEITKERERDGSAVIPEMERPQDVLRNVRLAIRSRAH
jgi:hypothetical protein